MLHMIIRGTVNIIVGGPKSGEFSKRVRVIPFTFQKVLECSHAIHNSWEIQLKFLGIEALLSSYEYEVKGTMDKHINKSLRIFGYPKYNPHTDEIPF